MAEIVLFHHVQGLTPGVVAFADDLRAAGHVVHTPDLYAGRTFESIEAGAAHAAEVGPERDARADRAVADLPEALVYAGMSSGVLAAQRLAQTRAGAVGALLLFSFVDPSYFSEQWPPGVPVQIHAMDADPFFVDEGDIDAARPFVAGTDRAELFLYPGEQHLFADRSLASYDADATALLLDRVLAFLDEGPGTT